MWWKTSKDQLIELLRQELAQSEKRAHLWQAMYERKDAEVDEHRNLAREAVELSQAAVTLLPESVRNAHTVSGEQNSQPRTMSAYCANLTERSKKHAMSKGKNLVAEMPPPMPNYKPNAGA